MRAHAQLKINVSGEQLVEQLYPPSQFRHIAINRRELQAMIRYADDHQPLFYNGRSYELTHKSLGAGMYRVHLSLAKYD